MGGCCRGHWRLIPRTALLPVVAWLVQVVEEGQQQQVGAVTVTATAAFSVHDPRLCPCPGPAHELKPRCTAFTMNLCAHWLQQHGKSKDVCQPQASLRMTTVQFLVLHRLPLLHWQEQGQLYRRHLVGLVKVSQGKTRAKGYISTPWRTQQALHALGALHQGLPMGPLPRMYPLAHVTR